MNTEQVAKLKLAKKIIYTVRIDSKDDNSPIIFQKENSISIKLGIYAKGGTSFNLNQKLNYNMSIMKKYIKIIVLSLGLAFSANNLSAQQINNLYFLEMLLFVII